ncbi:MAG TPA: hypothetical protein VN706_11705 [Gemmatimonadaceae bacterium]|nr:hypothetical protein [Gemmatimonadaceae bacterium]
MKVTRIIAAAAVLGVTSAATSFAQSATQTVTFQVDAINQIAVSGSPSLGITTATAGSAPTTVTSSGATWSVTTNQSNAKVMASITTAMPTGLTLSATLAAPSGATSSGAKPLSTTAVDVVTGISKLNAAGLALTYSLDATAAAGVVTSASRVVTYTITGGA